MDVKQPYRILFQPTDPVSETLMAEDTRTAYELESKAHPGDTRRRVRGYILGESIRGIAKLRRRSYADRYEDADGQTS